MRAYFFGEEEEMKRLLKGVGICALACAVVAAGMMAAVYTCSRRTFEAKKSDCIVILGARVWEDGTLSKTLWARVTAGLNAYNEGIAGKIIVCGGQGSNEPVSEAEAMRDYLIAAGVPAENIFMDDQSVNTQQNLENARAIMCAQNWTTAAIATSDYHLTRAMWIADDLGLDACGIAAPTPVRRLIKLTNYARESASWVVYELRKVF